MRISNYFAQTYPYVDKLHPSIENGWKDLKEAFGPGRVLVVSNSAGTRKDFGGIAVSTRCRSTTRAYTLTCHGAPGRIRLP